MQDKIPSSVIKFIDDNRNKDYKINIDYSKNINEQPIKKDTRILLSIIYRDYLCGDEERENLIKSDKIKLQQNKKQEYDYNSIFKDRKKTIFTEETSLIEYKESIFRKIINSKKNYSYNYMYSHNSSFKLPSNLIYSTLYIYHFFFVFLI